jgi:hypothetical protein
MCKDFQDHIEKVFLVTKHIYVQVKKLQFAKVGLKCPFYRIKYHFVMKYKKLCHFSEKMTTF